MAVSSGVLLVGFVPFSEERRGLLRTGSAASSLGSGWWNRKQLPNVFKEGGPFSLEQRRSVAHEPNFENTECPKELRDKGAYA